MQHLNVIPRSRLCDEIGISRSTIKRLNHHAHYTALRTLYEAHVKKA